MATRPTIVQNTVNEDAVNPAEQTIDSNGVVSTPTITLEQSQSTSATNSAAAVPYTAPLYTADQAPENLAQITTNNGGAVVNAGPVPILKPGTYDANGNPVNISPDGTITNASTPEANSTAGAGAASEDSGKANPSKTQQETNASGSNNANATVTPKPNVLDQYASYTYSLSLYLITDAQFNSLQTSKPNFSDWLLLIQSGGAQNNPSSSTNPTSGRSPYFNLDYYIDDLVLESEILGHGSNFPHNVGKLSFKVYEPNGINFVNSLTQAVINLYAKTTPNEAKGESKVAQWNNANFVMVIRFYGYNDAGNLVQVGTTNQTSGGTATGAASSQAQGAVVTKFYPFQINKLDFRISNKMVEYSVVGAPTAYLINAGSKRGSIPNNFNLVGETVKTILSGTGQSSSNVTPEDGRATTPTVPDAPPAPSQATVDPTTNEVTSESDPNAWSI